MISRYLLYCFCFLLAAQQSMSQPTKKKLHALSQQLDSFMQAKVNAQTIPGAVLIIKKDGRIIHNKAYGYAQIYQSTDVKLPEPERMSTGHLFDIASLTKVTATTTAIMLLADRGKLSVDDPVSKYIDGFSEAPKSAITIRHLLTHTAGLYEWYPMYYKAHTRAEVYELIHQLPLAFPVGKQRKYSDLGFTLLGEIIEKISGKPLNVFVETEVFAPLGMTHTYYLPLTKNNTPPIAATSMGNPYENRMVYDSSLGFHFAEINPTSWNGWRNYVLKGEVNDGNAWYGGQGISGAAGIFSTAVDLQKLVDMLMNKGKANGKLFLHPQTISNFLTPDSFHNGLGWMMDPANSFMKNTPAGSFGHTGFTGTSICVVPSQHLSIILLINRQQVGLLPSKEYVNVNPIRLFVVQTVEQYMH